MTLRHARHTRLSDEADRAWRAFTGRHGVSFAAMVDQVVHHLDADPRWAKRVVADARKVDVERRARKDQA